MLAACLLFASAAPALAFNFGPPPDNSLPPQLARPPNVPSDRQLIADHAHIGRIEIHIIQVFDLTDPLQNRWIYRVADRLHVATRPSAVRAQLLFHTGELYSPRLLEESARNIRQNSTFLREPVIRPIDYHDGIVDIEVITHDVWTLQPGANFSRAGGVNSYGFQIADANVLGTGKYVRIGHTESVDRSSTYMNWNDPNIVGSHWTDNLQYEHNSDGTLWSVGANYPFFSLETPQSIGIDAGNDHSVVRRYRLGDVYDAYSNDWRTGDFYVGAALVITERWTDRLMVGWRVDESSFNQAQRFALHAPLPQDRNLSYPFVRMQWIRNNYVTMTNLAMIARTEDVHLGLTAAVGAGYAAPLYGSDRHSLLFDSEASDAFALTPGQQLFVSGRIASRFEQGALHDGVLTGSMSYYLATSHDTRFYAALSADIGHRLDGDRYFQLGGDTGLRGYPLRYQNGNQLALFTVEERLYTSWFPLQLFNVGGAVFYDMGRTWGTPLVAAPQFGLLKDVGIGLRLGNARSSFGSVIHVDLAVPLDHHTPINHVQFLISTQQSY
jgi:Omp85 superfamily domain